MNFYDVNGRLVGFLTSLVSQVIGYKNIESQQFGTNWIVYNLKNKYDGLRAEIRFLKPGEKGIYWSIDDFEQAAKDLAKRVYKTDDWESIFDKNNFQDALDRMVDKHDATIGITWDTLDIYLEEHCLKKDKDFE